MLQAHSLLWHYLWVAPNVLLLLLALLLLRDRAYRQHPAFFAFAALSAVTELTVYAADMAPSVTPLGFWLVDWTSLLIEGPLKFILIGAVFSQVFGSYVSVARLGRVLIRGVGIFLVLAAAVAAAYAPKNGLFGIVSGAHILEQTIYLIEAGLLVFIFALSGYFRLSFSRPLFGIALGLSISACVHLATWAVSANASLGPAKRVILDFLDMGTYHICVLIWFYYLLVPQKVAAKPAVSLPEDNLAVWNRELERLIHQ